MLSNAEKRFIMRGIQANAPMTFISHHIWLCRRLKVEPDMIDLQNVDDDVQAFILDSK